MGNDYEKKALGYHAATPPGKIAVHYTKPLDTQEDLALAYSPGVAGPCRAIAADPDLSFAYTTRSNLVGVISNGTAVLGLGNIGPYAAKPVMEGKAMLFKKFAGIDVFDIELAAEDPDAFIAAVKALEPTFGGINLEDIKAPECFYIEERLRAEMAIPVFHDDQHGTAIIAGAAFINACELTGRELSAAKVVFSGAGAAAISCASLFRTLGVPMENILMCDSKGVLHTARTDLNTYKLRFARDTAARTLEDALVGADAFVGVSNADVLTPAMLLSMANHPIVFALANPNPEINPDLARRTRSDVIIATGRSDYPNQVNNVLGFPYIFRGALDVRATTINEEMKLAAVRAIAGLAKEDVPEEVMAVYKSSSSYTFGRDYLIPKPVDQRVLLRVAPAVAQAAMQTGVARQMVDMDEYQERMERILGPTRRIVRRLRKEISAATSQGQRKPKIVLTAGYDARVLKAAKQAHDGGEVELVLLGKTEKIMAQSREIGIKTLAGIHLLDPLTSPNCERYAEALYELRKRRGVSRTLANELITSHDYFAATMLHLGEVDAMLTGFTTSYSEAVRPVLEVIRAQEGKVLAGVYMMVKDQAQSFFADCTLNIDPTAEQLCEIAIAAAQTAALYTDDPIRVAMLSFASFGVSRHPQARKVAEAVALIRAKAPHLEVDGEMQVDIALDAETRHREYPFSSLKGNANVLIFPDVGSANISYKILTRMGGMTPTGPILVGIRKPAHVLQRSATVQEIVNMIYISAHQARRAP